MEGFKSNPKMRSDIACYKEGGSVGYKSRKNHAEEKEMSKDIAKDKAMIKKGVAQHEAAKHKGEEKTELKLKSGGRAKKEKGTVKKYKAGGSCYKEGGETKKAIAMKKDATDKKVIAKTKASASAPKKKAPKTTMMPIESLEITEIEEIPAFQAGGFLGRLKDNVMGTPEQNARAEQELANRYGNQQGTIADVERFLNPKARKKIKPAEMPMPESRGANVPGMGRVQPAPMPSPEQRGMNVPGMGRVEGQGQVSDTESILEGLRQLGKYASGGGVY